MKKKVILVFKVFIGLFYSNLLDFFFFFFNFFFKKNILILSVC